MLDEEVIVRNGKKYAWTIPLAFPVDEATAKDAQGRQTVARSSTESEVVGSLDVSDVYPVGQGEVQPSVYGTDRDRPSRRPHRQ